MKQQAGRIGEMWGGLAASLVALPSAIAFGLVVFGPLGGEYASRGALAGILGAVAIGLIAPALGGTPRLVSAPCAPAAAVLGALAAELSRAPDADPARSAVLLGLVGLGAGLLQLLFGLVRGGTLIKFIPYPVVAGYLSGVGVLIFVGQLPKLLGLPRGVDVMAALRDPETWRWNGNLVGVVTMVAMVMAPRITRKVPAPIQALLVGVGCYWLLSLPDPSLRVLEGNALVIGSIGEGGLGGIGALIAGRFAAAGALGWQDIGRVAGPCLALAVLLSIDTLKTCVVIDALTRSRHNSNRELRGQGLGNVGSALLGGIPGAGTMGATLVNIHAGGQTRLSGILEGVSSLVIFLVLGALVAWVPVAALAGILIVVAVRMVDRDSFQLLRQRTTILDFAVVAAVVATALIANLMAAAGVGVALAILLFLREQIRGNVVRRRALVGQVFSRRRRLASEMAVLERVGAQAVVFELQGSLFFGTTDQLFTELEPHLAERKYVILDMRRVQSIDFTAVHMLEHIEGHLSEHQGSLILADIPVKLPTGRDLARYLDQAGLMRSSRKVSIFPTRDEAVAWVEDQVIAAEGTVHARQELALNLNEIEMLKDLPPDAIRALGPCLHERSLALGGAVFHQGDQGDELFFVRRGTVRIQLSLADGRHLHIATFGQGDVLGEMAFLDRAPRSADAVAETAVELYSLSRAEFDSAVQALPMLGQVVFSRLARTLCGRLRVTDRELGVLQEG